jgi:hypothetical protein
MAASLQPTQNSGNFMADGQKLFGEVTLDALKSKAVLATDSNGVVIEGTFPAEADTLQTVTTRGASTTTSMETTANMTVGTRLNIGTNFISATRADSTSAMTITGASGTVSATRGQTIDIGAGSGYSGGGAGGSVNIGSGSGVYSQSGGAMSLSTGGGGSAASSTPSTTIYGYSGGALYQSSGAGGSATSSGTDGKAWGGLGGSFYLTAGAGGNAYGKATANGYHGGTFVLYSGQGGNAFDTETPGSSALTGGNSGDFSMFSTDGGIATGYGVLKGGNAGDFAFKSGNGGAATGPGGIVTYTIDYGGSGYSVDEEVYISSDYGNAAYFIVTGVDENGAITSLTLTDGGSGFYVGYADDVSGGNGDAWISVNSVTLATSARGGNGGDIIFTVGNGGVGSASSSDANGTDGSILFQKYLGGTFLKVSSDGKLQITQTIYPFSDSTTGLIFCKADGSTAIMTLDSTNSRLVFAEGANIQTGTTTGTKIGTTTSEKLGFYNATPVVQQLAATDLGTVLSNLGLRASGTAYPLATTAVVKFDHIAEQTASHTVTFDHNITLSAKNIVTDTTTGTKIGTATNQKLGFFNATPIVQVANTTDLGTVLSNLGLRAAGTAYPITTSGAVQFTGGVTITTTNLTLTDKDIALGTTTGTKIGTGTTQKLSFWNATPVVQQAHIADATGGATVDTEARAAIASINALLATLGLTAAA